MNPDKPQRVLLIDNDASIAQAIAIRLTHQGYDCITANNGQEGFAIFSHGGIDLVITDLSMPMLDGAGLVSQIRESSRVPIIVVTGFSDQFRHRFTTVPNVTVLKKPFETQALLDLVELELAQWSGAAGD